MKLYVILDVLPTSTIVPGVYTSFEKACVACEKFIEEQTEYAIGVLKGMSIYSDKTILSVMNKREVTDCCYDQSMIPGGPIYGYIVRKYEIANNTRAFYIQEMEMETDGDIQTEGVKN